MLLPLQGALYAHFHTQGAALGYKLAVLSGLFQVDSNNRKIPTLKNRQCRDLYFRISLCDYSAIQIVTRFASFSANG